MECAYACLLAAVKAAVRYVDMKYDSYDLYLVRLKEKSVLRTSPNPNSAQVDKNAKSIKWDEEARVAVQQIIVIKRNKKFYKNKNII